MKRILFFIATILIFCMSIIPVAAEESGESEVVVTEEGTEAVVEDFPVDDLKAVLVILAESKTKNEAVDGVMQINPNASAGDALALIDAFEEMSVFWDCRECILYDLGEGLDYGIEAEWLEWYLDTYFPELPESCKSDIHIDEEVASEVVGIIEQSESKADAILATAEKLGITAEEAEAIINSVLEFGDLYLGESAWWLGFKDDIQKNMNFWVTVIVCIAAVIAIIGVIFVLLAKTNPTMRKAMFGMDDALKIAREQSDANSQTLGKIEKLALDTAAKDEAYNKIIDEKEDHIMKLSKQIKDLQIANEKERRSMVLAESYNLQILRLLCSRTALPLQDKAAIDLWFTKANESLKSELSAEDIKKIDTIATTLEVKDEEAV